MTPSMRLYLLFFTVLMTFSMSATQLAAFERYNQVKKFDSYFSKYSKRFFGPNFDWRFFKAQAVAESRLKPDAQSHVGAQGIMQIMPRTFDEIVRKYPQIKGIVTTY